FAEVVNLVPRTDDQQPVPGIQDLEWPWEKDPAVSAGNADDLDARLPGNLKLSQRVADQPAPLRNLHRLKPNFVQQVHMFGPSWAGIEKCADTLNLERGAQNKKFVAREQLSVRTGRRDRITLAIHPNNGTSELTPEREAAQALSKPCFRVGYSDFAETKVPLLVVLQPVFVTSLTPFLWGKNGFSEFGSDPV